MKRQEYMQALEEALRPYDETLSQDIMADFEAHFVYGLKSGHSEEEIITSLGSIDEVLKNIDEQPLPPKKETPQALVKIDQVKKVFIDTEEVGVDVKIETTSEDDVVYRYQPTSSYFNINQTDPNINKLIEKDSLYLSLKSSGINKKGSLFLAGELTVCIPDNIELVKISGRQGDILVEELNVKQLEAKTISGDISVEGVRSEVITLQTTNGDIAIIASTASVTVKTVNGDVSVNDVLGKFMIVNNTNGDIDVDVQVLEVALKSINGDIELQTAETIEKIYVETTSGDIELNIADNTTFSGSIETLRGDIDMEVDFPYMVKRNCYSFSEGKTVIDIKSLNGDIEVNQHSFNKTSHQEKRGGFDEAIRVLKGLKDLENLIPEDDLKEIKDLMAEVKIDLKRKK